MLVGRFIPMAQICVQIWALRSGGGSASGAREGIFRRVVDASRLPTQELIEEEDDDQGSPPGEMARSSDSGWVLACGVCPLLAPL